MSVHRILSGLVITVAALSPACSADIDDEQLSDESLAVPLDPMGGPSDPTDRPPGSGNGWEPNCATSATSINAIKAYAPQALWTPAFPGATYGDLAPNSDMASIAAPCRKKILKYLVRCALPADTFVTDPSDGERYWGWLEIAPSWRGSAISSEDQWYLTACLYQHLNGFGVEVPILLDGNRSPLYPPSQNHPEFVKRDSRIWGNLFTSVGDFAPNVCYETDLLNSCEEVSVIDTRLCDSDPTVDCNVNIVGPCSAHCYFDKNGQIACGTSGTKNIGSRLKEFGSYGAMCN